MRTSDALRALQENIAIALLRRPSLGRAVKGTGLNERHFPRDLRPAFGIAMTKSQDEIRRLVVAKDPRIWPLYGKRIMEWSEGQARAAARQLVNSIGCCEDNDPVSTVDPHDSSVSAPEVKRAPTHEPPEQRALFEKTLVAIRPIVGDLEEISSKRLVDELARIEGGPWAQWGKGRCHATCRVFGPERAGYPGRETHRGTAGQGRSDTARRQNRELLVSMPHRCWHRDEPAQRTAQHHQPCLMARTFNVAFRRHPRGRWPCCAAPLAPVPTSLFPR
jgi:hypothetical protein